MSVERQLIKIDVDVDMSWPTEPQLLRSKYHWENTIDAITTFHRPM